MVDIWTINPEGKILIDKRHPDKRKGLKWECTGGSILKGEDSVTGAVREIGEELGVKVAPENLKLMHTIRVKDRFVDTYINYMDVALEELVLQYTEVVDAKYVSFDELVAMWEDDELCPKERFRIYRDVLKEMVDKVGSNEND